MCCDHEHAFCHRVSSTKCDIMGLTASTQHKLARIAPQSAWGQHVRAKPLNLTKVPQRGSPNGMFYRRTPIQATLKLCNLVALELKTATNSVHIQIQSARSCPFRANFNGCEITVFQSLLQGAKVTRNPNKLVNKIRKKYRGS